ncbi:uncharacterized protein Dana_GF26714, isoform B [Drosophila ananassae]|nr:uncharacterized protein Dana_GF26714, isoform B [Drosophila ananassae]
MCNNFYCFFFARFMAGFGVHFAFLSIFILALENVGMKHRTKVGNLALALALPVGGGIIPWIVLWCDHWKFFNQVITLTFTIPMLLSSFILESATWLLAKGKIDKGMKVLKQVAKINKKSISDDVWSNINNCYTNISVEQPSKKNYRFYRWLHCAESSRRIGVIIIIMSYQFILSMTQEGLRQIAFLLRVNHFIIFSISELIEVPAGVVPLLLLDRVGRKPLSIWLVFICSFFCLCGIPAPEVAYEIIALCGMFFIAAANKVAKQWIVELLPTVIRGEGMALASVMEVVGSVLSPIVIITEIWYRTLPVVILALMSLIGGIIIFYLPETMDEGLSASLEESDPRWSRNQQML